MFAYRRRTIYISLIFISLILIGAAITGGFRLNSNGQNSVSANDNPKFWVGTEVISADPLEFDISSHHVAFRPVLASLVSLYKRGEIIGVLASQWSSNDSMTKWVFKIRPGMRFQNGDVITADIVVRSLSRIAYLLKQRGSLSGLFEHCIGYDQLNSPQADWGGLTAENDTIVFTFTKSMPKLLETISFGIYSITHPSDYNPQSGIWNDPKKVVASGPYSISEWNENSLKLELRSEFPENLRHAAASKNWIITSQPELETTADIVAGDSENPPTKDHQFVDGIYSSIEYLTCTSWSDPKSICHDVNNRKALRAKFGKAMADTGLPISTSFLPPLSPGVLPIQEDFTQTHTAALTGLPKKMRFRNKSTLDKSRYRNFRVIFEQVAHQVGSALEWVDADRATYQRNKEPFLESYDYDFSIQGSEIDVEDPRETIRFMFLSKEGIRLPDENGDITNIIKNDEFSLQEVNKRIWDQAIIWPILHHSHSFWVKKKVFDLSQLNTETASTDISWIGIGK